MNLPAQAEGFRTVASKGKVEVGVGDGFELVKLDQEYAYGTLVRTGRRSHLDLELSPGNTVRVMARAELAIAVDARDPKLKILKLIRGTVDVKLDNLPDGHSLDVETPAAICGAIGTRFVVSFEDASEDQAAYAYKDESGGHRFVCTEGEIAIQANGDTIADADLPPSKRFSIESFEAGEELWMVAQEQGDDLFTDVTVNRGSLAFWYGGEQGARFVVETDEDAEVPARFEVAMTAGEDGQPVIAFRMIRGAAQFRFLGQNLDAEITPETGAVFVNAQGQNPTGQAGDLIREVKRKVEGTKGLELDDDTGGEGEEKQEKDDRSAPPRPPTPPPPANIVPQSQGG